MASATRLRLTVLFAFCVVGWSAADATAYTWQTAVAPTSCPYTDTSDRYFGAQHRNPYYRWDEDTPHSTGVRYILTNGQPASDYLDIRAHDQSYHQPPNGYVAYLAYFWLRSYTPYGSCTNGTPTYRMLVRYGYLLS